MSSQLKPQQRQKTLDDFFPSVLALVDRVVPLLVGGGKYSVELVELHVSWTAHHGYPKKRVMFSECHEFKCQLAIGVLGYLKNKEE